MELSEGAPRGPPQLEMAQRRVEVEVKLRTRTESGQLSVLTFNQTDLTPLVMDPVLHDDSFRDVNRFSDDFMLLPVIGPPFNMHAVNKTQL